MSNITNLEVNWINIFLLGKTIHLHLHFSFLAVLYICFYFMLMLTGCLALLASMVIPGSQYFTFNIFVIVNFILSTTKDKDWKIKIDWDCQYSLNQNVITSLPIFLCIDKNYNQDLLSFILLYIQIWIMKIIIHRINMTYLSISGLEYIEVWSNSHHTLQMHSMHNWLANNPARMVHCVYEHPKSRVIGTGAACT